MVESLAQLGGIAVLADPATPASCPSSAASSEPGSGARWCRATPSSSRSHGAAVGPGRQGPRQGHCRWGQTACEADLLFVIVIASRPEFAPGHLERQLADRPPAPGDGVDRAISPTCCACRRPSAPMTSFPAALRRSGLRVGPPRRRALERGGPAQPGRPRRRGPGFGTADDEHGRGSWPPPAAGCGCIRSTCPTAAAWTTSTTRSSWPGWPSCAPPRRRGTRRRRWPCAATSTWPPPTATCGTRPFVGATHVSEPERQALRLEEWGLTDVFPRFNEPGTFTWWDYRAGDFHQGRGLRIDLVLLSRDLAERPPGPGRPRRPQGHQAVGPRPGGGRLG